MYDTLFIIGGIGIATAVVDKILKAMEKPEQALMFDLAALVGTLFLVMGEIRDLFDTVRHMFL